METEQLLSHNIKFLRKHHGYTLIDLAAMLEVSKSAVSDYENLKFLPSITIVNKYCKLFKVSMSHIVKVKFNDKDYENEKYKDKPTGYNDTIIADLKLKNTMNKQKIEALELQSKLLQNLIESKNSEIDALRIQIQLLGMK